LQENSTAVGGNSTAPPSGSNSGRTMITAEFPDIKQTVPPSYSHHLCLCPVHILQENSTAVGGNSTAVPSGSNSGRIMMSAAFAFIKQTAAAIEDDVLTPTLLDAYEL
jgi:hypothetical protein